MEPFCSKVEESNSQICYKVLHHRCCLELLYSFPKECLFIEHERFIQLYADTFTFSENSETALWCAEQNFGVSSSEGRSCSVKKVFLEISQNSQENTCARVSFLIKLQASGICSANQWTGFYMITASVMKWLKVLSFLQKPVKLF